MTELLVEQNSKKDLRRMVLTALRVRKRIFQQPAPSSTCIISLEQLPRGILTVLCVHRSRQDTLQALVSYGPPDQPMAKDTVQSACTSCGIATKCNSSKTRYTSKSTGPTQKSMETFTLNELTGRQRVVLLFRLHHRQSHSRHLHRLRLLLARDPSYPGNPYQSDGVARNHPRRHSHNSFHSG